MSTQPPSLSRRSAVDQTARELLEWLSELRAKAAGDGLDSNDLAEIARRVGELLKIGRSAVSRYVGLFDAAADAITLIDRNGHIVDANLAAERMFGWSRQELRERSVYDLNPSLPANHIERIWDNLAVGESTSTETTNRCKDGRLIPVEVHSRAYFDHDQKLIVAIARNISERLHSERELRAGEERYAALLQAVDKGVIVHDAKGRIVSMNASAERILGMDTEASGDLSRITEWDLYDDNGQAIEWSANPVLQAVRTGQRVESTVLGLVDRRTGHGRWVAISVVPQFREGESQPFQLISLFSDITELKRTAELFDQVQALARIGGWTVDLKQHTLYWTEALYHLLGRDPGAGIGRDGLAEMLVPEDRQRFENAVRRSAETGAALDTEVRVAHPSNRIMWVRVLGHVQSRRGVPYQMSGTVQEITSRKLEEERLRRQAQTDPLTGLLNRDTILAGLSAALVGNTGQAGPALMYVDLDRFKVVNDLIGHTAGDRLLVAAARRLLGVLPEGISAGRFGGDEFLVLMPSATSEEEVCALAETISAAFAKPFAHSGEEFVITPSIGIARYPNDGLNAQQLLNHADVAMYEAKRRGRNTWQMFSPALALQLKERLLIETQLRRAIENEEFYLLYQPKIDMRTGCVVGAEALLRWRSRVLGDLAPDTFIPIAETSGDIVRIGAFVLEQACMQWRLWHERGLTVGHVAVNVSFRQFLGESFERNVRRVLEATGVPAHALELEMTERALIEDAPATEQTLARLRDLGVAISIDDFGEGYSALGYLRRLPIAGIKISHNFMHGIPGHETDAKLCRAILQMAQALGLSVVAEGVETVEQRDFLLELGARYAQGFYFSKPLNATEFERFARDRECAI
ncbi:MAG: EAL domain-containing protein [Lysobacterales bacterium]|nr:EAL domain-containing protein [Xanthomonadales bacterium]MCB1610309.1 EAL domain-containing protein [Xanthomonadales bacterium]MCP5474863.1 EAL domain-containing protein [Rhodanobacteraceae bacterium]